MKKYIQPEIEIDTLEAKDIILVSIFDLVVGNKGDVSQSTTKEDVNEDGVDDNVGNVNVGVGVFGGGN